MAWSTQDRARAVAVNLRVGSPVATQRALRREVGWRRVPTPQQLRQWARALETQGTVAATGTHAPRPRVPPARVRAIRRAVARNPHLSIRRLAARTGAAYTTVQRVLRQQLRLYPFKLQLLQRLKRGDKAKRLRFCKWALAKWRSPRFRRSLLMSDEAQFCLDGVVNRQNCRIWGTENPHATHEHEGQSPSVAVWCGAWAKGIIGPFFIEEGNRPATLTGPRYIALIRDRVVPAIQNQGVPLSQVWFQQDGATPHTSRSALAFLETTFPGKVVSKKGDVAWPPRSPDLTAPDFWLWGYLKSQVYRRPVSSLRQLKQRIRTVVGSVSASMARAATNHVALRLRACLQRRGGHLEHVLPRS